MSQLQASHSLSGQLLWNFSLGVFPVLMKSEPASVFRFDAFLDADRLGSKTLWLGGRQFRLMPDHGADEAFAGIGMALPARLQHVAQQEQAGQAKAVL